MSRHEGTYVLRGASEPRGAAARKSRGRPPGGRRARGAPCPPRGARDGARGRRRAAGRRPRHGTRVPSSSRGRGGLMSETRWQHTVKIQRESPRTRDAFPDGSPGDPRRRPAPLAAADRPVVGHHVRSAVRPPYRLSWLPFGSLLGALPAPSPSRAFPSSTYCSLFPMLSPFPYARPVARTVDGKFRPPPPPGRPRPLPPRDHSFAA